MAISASTSLSVSIAHAIAYLTRPLILVHSATTIIKLQLLLEANLTALFAPSWVPKEPLRGSGRRCLTLSPSCLPPRAIYAACLAAGVQWFDWIALIGGREFDLFVDPGCISVRFGKKNSGAQLITIWSEELTSSTQATVMDESKIQTQLKAQSTARALKVQQAKGKTLAQQLLEEDKEEDEELFAMIADEVSAPTWMTPILDQFPIPVRSDSPLSVISGHSRSSSRSSNSISGFSFASSAETAESFGSLTSVSTLSTSPSKGVSETTGEQKLSRRERARQARVFVDTSKTEVTPYDGGKTTVLTGGVMLGAAPSAPKTRKTVTKPSQTAQSGNWRSARA